eukprot:g29132.t1
MVGIQRSIFPLALCRWSLGVSRLVEMLCLRVLREVRTPDGSDSPLQQKGGEEDGTVSGVRPSAAAHVLLGHSLSVTSNKGVPKQSDGAAVSTSNVVPDGEKRMRRPKGDDVRSCYSGEDVEPAVSTADLLVYGDPSNKASHQPGTLLVITVPVPVKEANKAPRFVESRVKDIQMHLNLGAVKLVRKQDVPKGTRIIGVRFADFDRFEGKECIEQKSRVVIPTPDELAIRTIFALATLQRVFLEAGDDESAFLKAKRDTPVYLRMPVEYIPKDHYFEAWAGVNGLRDSGHL